MSSHYFLFKQKQKMRLQLTKDELRGVEFTVDGKFFKLIPVEVEDDESIDIVDREEDIHEENNSDSTDSVVESDLTESVIESDDSMSDSSTEADSDDGETEEQFTIHHDKRRIETLRGRYNFSRRTGVWYYHYMTHTNAKCTGAFDFDRMTATLTVLHKSGETKSYHGGFRCTGNDIVFEGQWRCSDEDESLVWSRAKPYGKSTIVNKCGTIKQILRHDLTVAKQKNWNKNGTIAYSEDFDGWIKLKTGRTIHGTWVRRHDEYVLSTVDGKYYGSNGTRRFPKK